MSAEDHVAQTRAALVDFVCDRALWRAARAREWPEDPRNHRSAEALDRLAVWVKALPDSDERLQRLASYYSDEYVFLPAGEAAAQFTSRYGYTFPSDPDRFLGVLLAMVNEAQSKDA